MEIWSNKKWPIGCWCPMAASKPADTSTKSGLKHLKIWIRFQYLITNLSCLGFVMFRVGLSRVCLSRVGYGTNLKLLSKKPNFSKFKRSRIAQLDLRIRSYGRLSSLLDIKVKQRFQRAVTLKQTNNHGNRM